MKKWIAAELALLMVGGASAASKPNVIVILTDDQGYGDFSCYGNPILKTPNVDKLHEQSVRFTDFHVAPVCTPTRGQLMTGMDAMHNGAWSWAYGHEMVHPENKTIAEIFKENGYATAMYGKWHLGENYPYRPSDRGFDDSITMGGGGSAHQSCDYWQNDCFDDYYRETDGVWRQQKGYCTDVFFKKSIDFMARQQKAGKPFFLYLPTTAAHSPHYVADTYVEPYKGIEVTGRYSAEAVADFFGMIANFDENLGRLDAFMEKSGLAKNTIVLFMTDNGGTAGVYVHNAGMRGHKSQFYEGGHRVPCFIRSPFGDLGAPRDIDTLTQVQDILPTLMALCGLTTDPQTVDKFDGRSLVGLMTGKKIADRKLVAQWSRLDQPQYGQSVVLWKKWRLVLDKELYNIGDDPGQENDVAKKFPEIVKTMKAHYAEWWKTTESVTSITSRIGLGGAENPVRLSCFDWTKKETKANVTQQQTIWAGQPANGQWGLKVEQSGTYRFSLRRYPEGAKGAMSSGLPERQREHHLFPACKALPISQARLKVGSFDQTIPVTMGDKAAVFEVKLPAGQIDLKTWLMDAQGHELCGAFYVDVERL